jgi:hypothetical protein
MYLFCCIDADPCCWLEKDLENGKQKYLEENEDVTFKYSDPVVLYHYNRRNMVYYTEIDDNASVWILELNIDRSCTYHNYTNIYYDFSLEDMMQTVRDLFDESTGNTTKEDVETMYKKLLEKGSYGIPDELLSEDSQEYHHHFTLYNIKN